MALSTSDVGLDAGSSKDMVVLSDDSVVMSDNKKRKVDDKGDVSETDEVNDGSWIRVHGTLLKNPDKLILLMGNELNDRLINAAQKMLMAQFPLLKGLQSTLVQYHLGYWPDNYLQIVHCRSSHWITVSSIGCQREVKMYDSLYDRVDDATKRKIEKALACKLRFIVPVVQKQQGYKDCSLFSIAFATHLAFGKTQFEFKQDCMCQHLIACIEKQHICFFITATLTCILLYIVNIMQPLNYIFLLYIANTNISDYMIQLFNYIYINNAIKLSNAIHDTSRTEAIYNDIRMNCQI